MTEQVSELLQFTAAVCLHKIISENKCFILFISN